MLHKSEEYAAKQPETEFIFQYSPECFTATELEVAKDVCDAVTEIWEASPTNKVILNLPATVEVSGYTSMPIKSNGCTVTSSGVTA